MVHWGLTRGGSAQSSWDEHLKSQRLSSDHHIPGADQALVCIRFILAQPESCWGWALWCLPHRPLRGRRRGVGDQSQRSGFSRKHLICLTLGSMETLSLSLPLPTRRVGLRNKSPSLDLQGLLQKEKMSLRL